MISFPRLTAGWQFREAKRADRPEKMTCSMDPVGPCNEATLVNRLREWMYNRQFAADFAAAGDRSWPLYRISDTAFPVTGFLVRPLWLGANAWRSTCGYIGCRPRDLRGAHPVSSKFLPIAVRCIGAPQNQCLNFFLYGSAGAFRVLIAHRRPLSAAPYCHGGVWLSTSAGSVGAITRAGRGRTLAHRK